MKKRIILCLMATVCMLPAFSQTQPYKNPQLTAEQRADDLLKRLTLE